VGTVELEPEVTAWLDDLADDEIGHVDRRIDLLADQDSGDRRRGAFCSSRRPDSAASRVPIRSWRSVHGFGRPVVEVRRRPAPGMRRDRRFLMC
jgi:hypothetical protein